jgi:hypothetical protein
VFGKIDIVAEPELAAAEREPSHPDADGLFEGALG